MSVLYTVVFFSSFPSEYFGIMYGIMFIVSGAVSMLQYGLFAWAEAAGFYSVSASLNPSISHDRESELSGRAFTFTATCWVLQTR